MMDLLISLKHTSLNIFYIYFLKYTSLTHHSLQNISYKRISLNHISLKNTYKNISFTRLLKLLIREICPITLYSSIVFCKLTESMKNKSFNEQMQKSLDTRLVYIQGFCFPNFEHFKHLLLYA